MSAGHAVPFYCPYCGEEDIVPEAPESAPGGGHGHWSCRACLRGFRLSLTAIAVAVASPAAPTTHHQTTDSTTDSDTSAQN
jgi:predicted RNA-binding Zn-ribbon protein involved in translation (DUF1610 family)